MQKESSKLFISFMIILIFVGVGINGYLLVKKSSELRERVKPMEYGINFLNSRGMKYVALSFTDPLFIKTCRKNASYSVASVTPMFFFDVKERLWRRARPYPSINNSSNIEFSGKIPPVEPEYIGEVKTPGFYCSVFPSELIEYINWTRCIHPWYLVDAQFFPENISCDFCVGYYYFDEITEFIWVGHEFRTQKIMEDSWGPGLNSSELACGFYDTGTLMDFINYFEEDPNRCPEQLKLYIDGKVGYVAINWLSEKEDSFGVPCVPKVKLTPSKDVNILVVFAYSDQPIPADVITTLKGSTKDKSFNHIADWYRSEALRLINKSVNIDFTFLDKQYEVDIDPTYVKENYEIRDEIVAEEKFLYEELIQPLKQQGITFDDYDATLVLYNNPDLFSERIWISGGHADRHRGFAYVNLAVWLSNGKLDMGEAESIVKTSAHELGHVFGAYDIGTIEGKNCLMGSGSIILSENELCVYKDIGWYDVDGDGIIEIEDPCPYDKENFCEQ